MIPATVSIDKCSPVFVSYSAVDRRFAGEVKRLFAEFGVGGFLAHETIEVSELWRDRILAELRQCEIFVPVLSNSFLGSLWTQQEVGAIAVRDGVVVAPVSIDGTKPPGFLERYQCTFGSNVEDLHDPLIRPLIARCPLLFAPGLVQRVANASTYREAEAKLGSLRPLFPTLAKMELNALVSACIENSQVYDANHCREVLLPELLRLRGDEIEVRDLTKLRRLAKLR